MVKDFLFSRPVSFVAMHMATHRPVLVRSGSYVSYCGFACVLLFGVAYKNNVMIKKKHTWNSIKLLIRTYVSILQ